LKTVDQTLKKERKNKKSTVFILILYSKNT